ncbi:MAG: hypothetical protein NT115_12985 [Proteobacteria bacterium]|nr:hypothetical protein [Pseudomonadota bacterium]
MDPRQRFDFSPIVNRPPLKMPNGAGVAVYTVVNVEDWDFNKPAPRQYVLEPQGVATVPDAQNRAWHEYGLPEAMFTAAFDTALDPGVAAAAKSAHRLLAEVGGGGFPTFVLKHNGQRVRLNHAAGHSDPHAFAQALAKTLL